MSNVVGRSKAGAAGGETRLVIGTAGHVDHGKTTLIRALTGYDTDRLPEEKARGISIELGFAPFTLPSGARAAIVDVPGHERFVHHMLAGAQGMDIVLLVVAADEGVMPQTREHLDILTLLGIERGIVCLTKIDLVEPEWRQLVVQDLRAEIAGTFLEGAPVIPLSPVTGEGLDELRALLDRAVGETAPRSASGPARLPIDRVFSVPGFGTVVTGTLLSGSIALEDRLELVPSRRSVRVRSLQSHGESVTQLRAGQRTAVNLAGVDREDVARGQVLATAGSVAETRRVAAHVRLLASAEPLDQRDRVRLHVGTSEVIGRVTVLDGPSIAPGAQGFIRVQADEAFPVAARDRIVLRSFSPARTLGGGVVLDTEGRQRRGREEDLEELRLRLAAPPEEVILGEVRRSFALREGNVAERLGLGTGEVRTIAERLSESGRLRRVGELLVDVEGLQDRILRAQEKMRATWDGDPLWRGLDRDAWRRMVAPELDGRTAGQILQELAQQGRVRIEGEHVLPEGEAPPLPERLRRGLGALRGFLLSGGMQPAAPREWPGASAHGAAELDAMLGHLQAKGEVIRLGEIWFAREAVELAEQKVRGVLASGRGATTAELREALATTRRFAVPILEHLDQRRVTRRQGDLRFLFSL